MEVHDHTAGIAHLNGLAAVVQTPDWVETQPFVERYSLTEVLHGGVDVIETQRLHLRSGITRYSVYRAMSLSSIDCFPSGTE